MGTPHRPRIPGIQGGSRRAPTGADWSIGGLAVLVAVSAQTVLENFAAGLSLQLTTPFVVGDRIETAGITGWVEAITARAVVLTSRDRRTVYIPNSVVLESVLFNLTDDDRRRSEIDFSVAYGSEMDEVRTKVGTAVRALDIVHDDPDPVVYINELGEDGVNLRVRFYHADTDRITARDQVAETIMVQLAVAEIDMPTPEIAIDRTDK